MEVTMESQRPSLLEAILKTIVVHTVTYFFIGVLSFTLLDYSTLYAGSAVNQFLRQTSDPLVMAGPLFQPIRGLLLGAILFLLREPFFHRRRGWLTLWGTLVVIGIISPYSAGPGSLEGMVYTTVPLSFHLMSLPEILIQTLLFSAILFYWVAHPDKKWLTWLLAVIFFLVLLFPALGVFLA
jgi:hypothetical protein